MGLVDVSYMEIMVVLIENWIYKYTRISASIWEQNCTRAVDFWQSYSSLKNKYSNKKLTSTNSIKIKLNSFYLLLSDLEFSIKVYLTKLVSCINP